MDEGLPDALAAALRPKYRLRRRLGEGGMGSVYLAEEVALGRDVAVKLLSPVLARDEQFRIRFQHEARAAAGLQLDNVVQVYTVGEVPGHPPIPYIILQYVEGTSLETLIEEQGPQPELRARRLLRDVATGLAAAHRKDLVHRDIKPANILIELESGRAQIADFGISAALSPRAIGGAQPLLDDGMVLGTAPYMSPEQTLGEPPGPASDVYSLGVVAYQLLTGRLPFSATSLQGWMGAHRSQEPAPLKHYRKGISDNLVGLIERCLAKEPEARPAAAELARELVPSVADEVLWPPPGLLELPRAGRQTRRAALLLGAGLGILLVLLRGGPPGATTGAGWWQGWAGGSLIALDAGQAPPGWISVLWQLGVLGAAAAAVAGLGMLAGLLARSVPRLAGSRARGWRRETLLDALADPDGRTGLLLAGSGEFATLSLKERERVRRYRRLAHLALLAGACWVCLALSLWSLSLLLGRPLQPAGGAPASALQLAVVALPFLLAVALSAGALLREVRASGRSWRRTHSGSFAVPSDEQEQEVGAWYAELPGSWTPEPRRRPRLLTHGVPLAGAAVLAWSAVALVLLVGATLLAGRAARLFGPDTAKLAAMVEGGWAVQELAEARALLRSYQPPAGAAADSSALAGLVAAAPYPLVPSAALGARLGEVASTRLAADLIRRAALLAPDTLRLLAALASHPRTELLRAAARSLRPRPPPESGGGQAVPAVRDAIDANTGAAVLAAARGDFTAAALRLGENAAIAEGLLDDADPVWTDRGLRWLHVRVLLPLAELERLRGNPAREAELTRLARGVNAVIERFQSWPRGGVGLGSDPRRLELLLRLRGDSTVPRGLRTAVLAASGDAACLNPRELLAGAAVTRRDRLGEPVLVPEPFQVAGLRGLAARVRYCLELSTAQSAR